MFSLVMYSKEVCNRTQRRIETRTMNTRLEEEGMKTMKTCALCLLFVMLAGSFAVAFENEVDPAGYLEYTLPENVKIGSEEKNEYILSWKPLPDVYEYHVGVFRHVEGVRGKASYLQSGDALPGRLDVKDGTGKTYCVPFTLLNAQILDGSATEAHLDDIIVALGAEPDPLTGHKTLGYYCLVMIVPQEGKPVTQLIKLPSEPAKTTPGDANADVRVKEWSEEDIDFVQTTTQLIRVWMGQYPLNFEVSRLPESDVDTKVHVEAAMIIALDFIMGNYNFTFDDLKTSSPQVIFSAVEDAWLVHIVPTNPVRTFSITVDSETGLVTDAWHGVPTG